MQLGIKMHLQTILKSVQVLLLNMCNILELSGTFFYLWELLHFSVPEGTKKMLGCGLLGGYIYQKS